MNVDEFIAKMNSLRSAVENELPDIMVEAGTSAVTLINQRFEKSGTDANGSAFGEYSPTTIAIKQKKSKQTSFVDLKDTNRMWSNIGVLNIKTGSNIAIVKIGGRNDFTRKKLNDNTERFGKQILKLSLSETKLVGEVVQSRMKQIVNRTF